MIRCEYFYLIRHKASGKFYAGSSYKKTCNPDQFWKTYFTSSKIIHSIINDEGKDSFEILEIIPRPLDDARLYEQVFLTSVDAKSNSMWFNKTNGNQHANIGSPSYETRLKQSNKMKNKPLSDLHRQKLSEAGKGRVFSAEHKLKLSISHKGKISPNKNKQSPNKGIPISEETKAKISLSNKGKIHSSESKMKHSTTMKLAPRLTCPHCNKIGDVSNMKRWHFDKCSSKELT